MQACNTGWRHAAAIDAASHTRPVHTEDKSALFEAARLCCRVLDLPSSCRFLLDQLCAAFGGQAVDGRAIVWPSNRYLSERTGIPERTIRHAIRRLIDLGVIEAKDSPNGKRYARKDAQGRVTTAYGFDLSPLLHRLSEFKDRMIAIKERARECRAAFDKLTVTRRNAQGLLHRLMSEFPRVNTAELEERTHGLLQALPRRSPDFMPDEALRLWTKLLEDLESEILAASPGKTCRHKDTNKNPPQSPCSNGSEMDKAKPVRKNLPDAIAILGGFRHEMDMIEIADRYRGVLGISKDAWLEACRTLGAEDAARLVYLVTQIQARPSPAAPQIRNFGGYFRAMTRRIADQTVDLDAEIRRRGYS